MKKLGEDLYKLDSLENSSSFSNVIVEGLDTILLSLKDIVSDFNEEDIMLLKIMTSNNSKGIDKVRSEYLNGKHEFDQSGNVLLLSAANLTERLVLLFGEIGQNYNKSKCIYYCFIICVSNSWVRNTLVYFWSCTME